MSDPKELMVHRVCMAYCLIKSKLRNIFARSTAIQTSESSWNLSDKSSRDAGNNGEKGGMSPRVL